METVANERESTIVSHFLDYPFLFTIPSPQRLFITLPLRPGRAAVRTDSLKISPDSSNLSLRAPAERAMARLLYPAPFFLFAIFVIERFTCTLVLVIDRSLYPSSFLIAGSMYRPFADSAFAGLRTRKAETTLSI
jgi:hypothetical protein